MTPAGAGADGAAEWTIASVSAALGAKKISARELTREFYERIERRNPELNAYLALSPERAYAQADRVDAMIASGETLPPLAGVPIAIKDVLTMHGVPTTCGSRILEGYRPPYDATAVERLEAAGAILLGKWEARMRIRLMGRCEILWRWIACREDRAGARPRLWRRAWRSRRWGRIRAGQCGSRDRFAGYRRCCRVMGGFRGMG
jgi:hypothetical protein